MRAGVARAQPLHQFALEIGGHGVFQLLRLVMHLVPFQAEDFGQHAFDELMAVQQTAGDLAAGGREGDLPFGGHVDEGIALEPLNGHGDGRRRDMQPAREGDGLDGFALRFGFRDGLEVILFRDGDSHGTQPN